MTAKSAFEQEHAAPPELRFALEAIGNPVSKTKSSILFRRGDKPVGVFVVRKGKVSLDLDGSKVASRTLGPGSVLGLPATLTGKPYSLTATVARDCELDFIPRRAALRLLHENSFLCFQALRILGSEISDMRGALDKLLNCRPQVT